MHCAEITCLFGRADSGVWERFVLHSLASPAFCLTSAQLCNCIKDGVDSQFSSSHMSTDRALISYFTFLYIQINYLTVYSPWRRGSGWRFTIVTSVETRCTHVFSVHDATIMRGTYTYFLIRASPKIQMEKIKPPLSPRVRCHVTFLQMAIALSLALNSRSTVKISKSKKPSLAHESHIHS